MGVSPIIIADVCAVLIRKARYTYTKEKKNGIHNIIGDQLGHEDEKSMFRNHRLWNPSNVPVGTLF